MSEFKLRYALRGTGRSLFYGALSACIIVSIAGCALTAEELEAKGDRLIAEGDPSRAISAYYKAQKQNPENLNLGWKIAQIQQSRGMIDEAIKRYEGLLILDPEMHQMRIVLAELQADKGLWSRAASNVQILKKALARDVRVYKLQARIAQQNHDMITALTLWRVAAQIDPNDPTIHHAMGTIYIDRGDLVLAVAAFENTTEADPEYGEAYFELGLALIELNRIDEAERAYRRYIDSHQRDEKAYYKLGNALFSKRYFSRAIIQYERAISIKPDYTEAHFNLGMANVQTKHFARARVAFEQTLKWTNREEFRESATRMLQELDGFR